jgi:CelD/BcsL family acetyltransferase involved in cellulose biosynthesis
MTPDSPPEQLVAPFADHSEVLGAAVSQALRGHTQDATLFASLPWFAHLAATSMVEGAEPAFLSVDAGGPACMPILRRTHAGMRRLEALSNFYTPEFAPVAGAAQMQDLTQAFARFAAGAMPRPDIVDLRPLDSDAAFYRMAQTALRRAGFWVDTYFCFGNWYLELAGQPFAEYFDTRPSQLRNTWRRNRKKLEQRGLAIEILRENSPALEAGITAYETIYNSSWKHPEPFPEFIPGLCRMAAAHGWLRLGVLSIDGRAVASQIWFVKDGVASIFKLAYIEEFGKLSVGTVLTHELMRSAIDADQVRVIDYLSGDDAYKKDWMTRRRERRGIIAFNKRSTKGVMAAARHFGAAWIKSLRRPASAAPVAAAP